MEVHGDEPDKGPDCPQEAPEAVCGYEDGPAGKARQEAGGRSQEAILAPAGGTPARGARLEPVEGRQPEVLEPDWGLRFPAGARNTNIMVVGHRREGYGGGKDWVQRHGGGGSGRHKRRRASAAREEKALETKERQAGKAACRDGVS